MTSFWFSSSKTIDPSVRRTRPFIASRIQFQNARWPVMPRFSVRFGNLWIPTSFRIVAGSAPPRYSITPFSASMFEISENSATTPSSATPVSVTLKL